MKMPLENIPLEDSKVFREISQGNTIGIFQLESQNEMGKVPLGDCD